ncbi:MAG TPA: prepilin-type N-terminal cleavage/methylation domain-containing protein [Methylophilus sp.]|nr:prepilin-type N-terminal cleavage/methylation domain-containing protein [Methylophilus sp.]HQQ32452.1 prepilin-type N-terminal cleavage/methylation domain-containing protein [Methylophilus sp.]
MTSTPHFRFSRHAGLTLIEIIIAMAIIAVLAQIAIPAYEDYKESAKVKMAAQEIAAMGNTIEHYFDDNREYPDSLADVGLAGKLDPWERPYVYLNLTGANKGQARKDHNLVPINTYFDLYSTGKDGKSTGPLTAKASRDDVIYAHDGRYIGLASKF